MDWLGKTNISVAKSFDGDITPEKIIHTVEAVSQTQVKPQKTLIILDEIQSCERALMSLKMFCEEAPEYRIAAAGSLLDVAINREKYSFPVGKVHELTLYPLDFEEFLWANGDEILAEQIREHFKSTEPMPEAAHVKALDRYKQYLIIGGMPAVVNTFVQTKSIIAPVEIQQQILNDYTADMAKYASTAQSVKIRGCYDSIPVQLAKEKRKFQYKIVQRGGTATIFGESLDWLTFAGLIHKCNLIDNGFTPVAAYVNMSDFKIYGADVGLVTLKSGMPAQLILATDEPDNRFLGGLAENYVAQALACNGHKLYYWKNKNSAEVDFVIQTGENIIPIEVKKSVHSGSTSLKIFRTQYNCTQSYRISQKNFGSAEGLKCIPHYAVFCV